MFISTIKKYDDRTEHYNKDGQLHREDGPAVEYNDGYKEYWIEGVPLSEEEFKTIQAEIPFYDKLIEDLKKQRENKNVYKNL